MPTIKLQSSDGDIFPVDVEIGEKINRFSIYLASRYVHSKLFNLMYEFVNYSPSKGHNSNDVRRFGYGGR